ncbi:MAG: hypothetical protein M3Y18_05400 [Candidatus Eremiobacteraeota bacterium]|nr:hypothetical protein [Candidatus Eremiobacteraeota bacterium]
MRWCSNEDAHFATQFLPATTFQDTQAASPLFEDLQNDYAAIEARIANAPTSDEALAAFRDWDDVRRRIATWASLTSLHFQQDTGDERARAENERCNELQPKIEGLDFAIKRRLLASPHRSAMQAELGIYAFALW